MDKLEDIYKHYEIGDSLFPVNNAIVFRGMLYIFKPDGVYQLYGDYEKFNPSEQPQVYRIYSPDPPVTDLGGMATVYKDAIFFTAGNTTFCITADHEGCYVYKEVPDEKSRQET